PERGRRAGHNVTWRLQLAFRRSKRKQERGCPECIFQVTHLQVAVYQRFLKRAFSGVQWLISLQLLPPSTRAPRLRCLTPPPKHWSAREKRTASRPRLAALSLRHAAWNVIARLHMFVAATSRDGSRSGGSVKMRPNATTQREP